MIKKSLFVLATMLAVGVSGAALADSPDYLPRTTTETFMGMSQKAPPTEGAANSWGTRTETTSWTRNHRRHWNQQWNGHNDGGPFNNGTMVITDYPGKNR